MESQEYKRLRRLVLRCFLALLLVIVAVAYYGSFRLKDFNGRLIASKPTIIKQTLVIKEKPMPGINGINGSNGTNGSNGLSIRGEKGDSIKGGDGASVTADQIATAVATYLQANPPAMGLQGPAGRVIFERTNPITGLEECKYLGDLVWQPITECQ